ncbi:uncharacterized protein [Macrobrachium rosenbergii]|uniref:uncharacterized protein n=1 Tax=Macrobrachium rosenbergii TaxID=79674 RepID=UPI0034D5B700
MDVEFRTGKRKKWQEDTRRRGRGRAGDKKVSRNGCGVEDWKEEKWQEEDTRRRRRRGRGDESLEMDVELRTGKRKKWQEEDTRRRRRRKRISRNGCGVEDWKEEKVASRRHKEEEEGEGNESVGGKWMRSLGLERGKSGKKTQGEGGGRGWGTNQ